MELLELKERFEERGIEIVAVSSNSRELAERSVEEWGLEGLTVGYGLGLEAADEWGLFVSAAAKENEPAYFNEPALFVVRPDGELYASMVQTMPFSRPPAEALLGSLEWIVEKGYPARGEADVSAL